MCWSWRVAISIASSLWLQSCSSQSCEKDRWQFGIAIFGALSLGLQSWSLFDVTNERVAEMSGLWVERPTLQLWESSFLIHTGLASNSFSRPCPETQTCPTCWTCKNSRMQQLNAKMLSTIECSRLACQLWGLTWFIQLQCWRHWSCKRNVLEIVKHV